MATRAFRRRRPDISVSKNTYDRLGAYCKANDTTRGRVVEARLKEVLDLGISWSEIVRRGL